MRIYSRSKTIILFSHFSFQENIVIGDVKLVKLPDATYDVVCAREFMQCAPDRTEYCAQFLVSL